MAAERQFDESNFFDYLLMYGPNEISVCNFVAGGGRFDPKTTDKDGHTQLYRLTRICLPTTELLRFFFENGGAPNTEWRIKFGEKSMTELEWLCILGVDDEKLKEFTDFYNARLPQAPQTQPAPTPAPGGMD
jgi:hypothetical protein